MYKYFTLQIDHGNPSSFCSVTDIKEILSVEKTMEIAIKQIQICWNISFPGAKYVISVTTHKSMFPGGNNLLITRQNGTSAM